MIGFSQAGKAGHFDAVGFPVGHGWEAIPFPAVKDEHAYALEISVHSMEPAYRDGTVIVLSPTASIRRGDRVVVKTRDGEVMVRELKPGKSIELRSVIVRKGNKPCLCATCCGYTASPGRVSNQRRDAQAIPAPAAERPALGPGHYAVLAGETVIGCIWGLHPDRPPIVWTMRSYSFRRAAAGRLCLLGSRLHREAMCQQRTHWKQRPTSLEWS
jgi:hypothetical protein